MSRTPRLQSLVEIHSQMAEDVSPAPLGLIVSALFLMDGPRSPAFQTLAVPFGLDRTGPFRPFTQEEDDACDMLPDVWLKHEMLVSLSRWSKNSCRVLTQDLTMYCLSVRARTSLPSKAGVRPARVRPFASLCRPTTSPRPHDLPAAPPEVLSRQSPFVETHVVSHL